jgi:hypothetical protein
MLKNMVEHIQKRKIYYIFSFALAFVVTVYSLFFVSYQHVDAGTSQDGSFTVAPVTSTYDNLIGADDARWVFTVTTTQDLVRGEIVQLKFPVVSQAEPFDITGVSVVSSTNITLLTSLGSSSQTEQLTNGGFETSSVNTFWTPNNWSIDVTGQTAGSGASTERVTDSNGGTYAFKITNPTNPDHDGYGLVQSYSGLNSGDIYEGSLYAKSTNSASVCILYALPDWSQAYYFNTGSWASMDDSDDYISCSGALSTSYTNISFATNTVHSGGAFNMFILPGINNGSEDLFIDNISLTKQGGSDIATNGTLEAWSSEDVTSLDGWSVDSEGDTTLANSTTSLKYAGSYSMNMQSTSDGNGYKPYVYQSVTGLTSGASLTASVYAYDTHNEAYMMLLNGQAESQTQVWNFSTNQWFNNSSSTSYLMGGDESLNLSSRDAWAQSSESFTAPANGTVFTYFSVSPVSSSYANIDNASLVLNQSTPDVSGVGYSMANNEYIVYGIVDGTVASGTAFSITLGGVDNGAGDLQNMQDLTFQVLVGTPTVSEQPAGALSSVKLNQSATHSLVRAGGPIISDFSSEITPSSYVAAAEDVSYTFVFTATSSMPIGSKIVLNFPSEFDVSGATVALQNINSSSTPAKIAEGAIVTSTDFGRNQITLTTSNAISGTDEDISVTVGGLTNPVKGVYRPFYVYTTYDNGGLLDGSYYGFESQDYDGPPPVDTVHIGGTNNIEVTVYKDVNGTETLLSESDLEQVRVSVGCPDKGFFVGTRFLSDSSTTTFENLLDCNYMLGVEPANGSGDSDFFGSFLPPSFKVVPAFGDASVSADLVFGIPDSFLTGTITGGVADEEVYVMAYSSDYETWGQLFTTTDYTTPGLNGSGIGYFKIPMVSGQNWNVSVMEESLDGGSDQKYWPPAIPAVYVSTSGTTALGSFAYIEADKDLVVTLSSTGGGDDIQDACVGVKPNSGGMFMPPRDVVCQANGTDGNAGKYVFKVPQGSITIEIMRPGKGMPEQYPVAIGASGAAKTIYLENPDTYISVSVVDAEGNAIGGAPVFAHGSNGFSQGVTNSSGTTTLYIAEGTYRLDGFAPGLGKLTAWTESSGLSDDGFVVVTSESNPSAVATVNVSSFNTISGQVTIGGEGMGDVKIGARGINGTQGGNGTETSSDGTYTLYLPTAGVYEVGGWSEDTGGLEPQQVDISSVSVSDIDWTLNAQGTLEITIENASDISPLFGGAFNPNTGRGNGTESWSTSGSDKIAEITLPAGTYEVHAGSPMTGPLVEEVNVVIVAGSTSQVYIDAQTVAGSMVTLSGTVDSDGTAIEGAVVWASRVNGPGHYETEADSSGDYSLKLPDENTYFVGVRELGYISTGGDVEITMSGNGSQDFDMTAAGYTISGEVTSGGESVECVWIDAQKSINDNEIWSGAPTDNGGNYEISVDTGIWTIYANGPNGFHQQVGQTTVTNSNKTVNVALTNFDGCIFNEPDIHAITDVSGGQVNTEKVVLDIPANAMGTSQASVSVSVSDADLVVGSTNATPIATSTVTLLATDSSGQSVSSFTQCINLELSYEESALPVGFDETDLQLGYWDSTEGRWKAEASTVDEDNNTISACVDHFTDFGPILPGVPGAPTSLAATATSDTQINLTWDTESSADYYVIYRNTTGVTTFTAEMQLATTTETSYSDTDLTAETTYYYEVAGYNDNGEGPNSDTVNATTDAATVEDSSPTSGGSNTLLAPPTFFDGEKAVSINDGERLSDSRDVVLTLKAENAVQMAISNSDDFSDASFISFSESYAWSITKGNGEKTVYVKFRSADGGTVVASDTVELISQDFDQYDAQATCPLDSGKAYKHANHPGIYYITDNCAKRPFKDEEKFFSYFVSWNNVNIVSKEKLNSLVNDELGFMPWGPLHDPKYGALVKTVTDPKVYLLLGTQRFWISNETIFSALGYVWDWIEDVSSSFIDKYDEAGGIDDTQNHPNYTLIRYKNSPHIYRIEPDSKDNEKQVKRRIENEDVFEQYKFRWDRIVEIDESEQYEDGNPMK